MTVSAETRLGSRRRRSHASFVPPQHGAWAFLVLPLALSWTLADHGPVWILLLWAWVAAYPTSYFALSMIRVRRNRRFRRPLLVWSLVTAGPALALVALRPWLVWPLLALVVLLAVNLGHARRNRERDIVNELVFVVQCSGMVPVSWLIAADPDRSSPVVLLTEVPDRVWLLTVLCALVLVGSTLHVKSLLRERRDPRYAVASRVFAVSSCFVGVMLALGWGLPEGLALLVPLVALAIRALVRDWSRLRPAQIGMVELALFVLTVVGAAVAASTH